MSGQLSMETWLLRKGATGAADPAAPLGPMQKFASPQQRCANKDGRGNRCKWWFDKPGPDAVNPPKWCWRCRRVAKRANKRYCTSEKGKAAQKRANTSEKGKASAKRYQAGEKGKARAKRYFTGEKGKASVRKYQTSEKGKARKKREDALRANQLRKSLHNMVRGVHPNPQSFRVLGIFKDNADAEAFFESTKTEPWMKDAPWGTRTTTTLPQTTLQIGHRIPKAWYRHDDDAEIKKAWSRTNLFAQCAVENHEAADRNQLSREGWLALKPIWPKQCALMTDEAAWQWASRNVDNATRKAERAAARAQAAAAAATAASTSGAGEAGPSDLNAVPESSSEEESGDEEADAAEAPDAYASEAESEEDEDEDEEESDDDGNSDSD